mmetsp:Transcript_27364/g.36322  ORF Transcript_27364/g.36322 Transcript_27364/m.36322 type:complete len:352 (-) Transcript_27364:3370-4425(-)
MPLLIRTKPFCRSSNNSSHLRTRRCTSHPQQRSTPGLPTTLPHSNSLSNRHNHQGCSSSNHLPTTNLRQTSDHTCIRHLFPSSNCIIPSLLKTHQTQLLGLLLPPTHLPRLSRPPPQTLLIFLLIYNPNLTLKQHRHHPLRRPPTPLQDLLFPHPIKAPRCKHHKEGHLPHLLLFLPPLLIKTYHNHHATPPLQNSRLPHRINTNNPHHQDPCSNNPCTCKDPTPILRTSHNKHISQEVPQHQLHLLQLHPTRLTNPNLSIHNHHRAKTPPHRRLNSTTQYPTSPPSKNASPTNRAHTKHSLKYFIHTKKNNVASLKYSNKFQTYSVSILISSESLPSFYLMLCRSRPRRA